MMRKRKPGRPKTRPMAGGRDLWAGLLPRVKGDLEIAVNLTGYSVVEARKQIKKWGLERLVKVGMKPRKKRRTR